MATKEPQTRRAFGEQGVSRWLPALACFARKAGARSVGAETPELDDERAPPSTSARSRKAREAVVQSTSTVRQGGNALVGRNDLAPKPDPENRLGRAKSAMMLEIEATTYLKTTSRRFATRA